MKIRRLAVAILLSAGATGAHAQAAAVVHPFEAVPRLGSAPPRNAMMAVAETGPMTCSPKGRMSRNGTIVTAELDFVRSRFTINNPATPGRDDEVELRSYGGCKSGPLIEVAPGDTLRVDFNNALSAQDPSCAPTPPPGLGVPPLVGCFNTTNLHTHGLHVSPSGNSDNVLLDLAPQTRFPYEINVPADHPSGTFWYHAHRHGSTAVNVASGASGVLIIRGERPYTAPTKDNPHPIADIDTILKDRAGRPLVERVFLFQQIPYACFQNDPNKPQNDWQKLYTVAGLNTVDINNNQPNNPTNFAAWSCPDPKKAGAPVSPGAVENFQLQLDSPTIWDTNGRFTSINGVVQPTITVAAGEIQRWRFVHAGIHDTINLQIVRAQPLLRGTNVIGASALVGNRQEQKADVQALCAATPRSLVPQYEVATDGLTRVRMNEILTTGSGKTQAMESNYLQPGYRSDILVTFPEDGDYCVLDQAAPPAQRVNRKTGQGNGGQGPDIPQLLAYVRVRSGTPVTGNLQDYVRQALFDANPQLPDPVRAGLLKGDLSPWAQFITSPPPTPGSQTQQAAFKIAGGPNGVAFTVNGVSYDPSVVNITRQVNTTDEWVLTSSGEPHIFHIHINPFQIVDVTTIDPKTNKQRSIYNADGSCNELAMADTNQLANQYCGMRGVFKDTMFVENNFEVKIRTTYDRYIGEFVLHCHILDHEDGGMMLNVAVVPDLTRPGHGLGMDHRH